MKQLKKGDLFQFRFDANELSDACIVLYVLISSYNNGKYTMWNILVNDLINMKISFAKVSEDVLHGEHAHKRMIKVV